MRIPLRRRARAAPALFLLMLIALALAPSAARAGDPDWPDDAEAGWRKMIAYGRCALQVFVAVTPAQWSAAFMDCGRLYLDEPPAATGGA